MEQHQIVSREEWLERRIPLLEQEKALTKHRDLVSAERSRLPWVRVDKDYAFDGPDGKLSLSDLFRGRSQLYIKHFMMAPGAQHQCVGCSLEVDHMTDLLPHLENHDVSYAVVARAPIEEIEVVRERMGWRFLWVFVIPQRLQLRLSRLIQAGRGRRRARRVQLPTCSRMGRQDAGPVGPQHFLQERSR